MCISTCDLSNPRLRITLSICSKSLKNIPTFPPSSPSKRILPQSIQCIRDGEHQLLPQMRLTDEYKICGGNSGMMRWTWLLQRFTGSLQQRSAEYPPVRRVNGVSNIPFDHHLKHAGEGRQGIEFSVWAALPSPAPPPLSAKYPFTPSHSCHLSQPLLPYPSPSLDLSQAFLNRSLPLRTPTSLSSPRRTLPPPSSPSSSSAFIPLLHRWAHESEIHTDRLIEQFGLVAAFDSGTSFFLGRVFDQNVTLSNPPTGDD